MRRLCYLKKRFQQDLHFFEDYRDTVNGNVSSDYARRVPCKEQEAATNTPVFHPQKPEKVTVVFDCASKLKDTSLNDQLLQSPDLTNGLLGVVIRFCREPVTMVVDVEGMFHHV